MFLRPPIRGPFPDIADHVVKTVAIRRERTYRRGMLVTVEGLVFSGKVTLPGIRHMAAIAGEFVAPGVFRAI